MSPALRMLNITILVGAGSKLVIPVSCVERGRWSYTSRHFDASDRMLFAKARSSKAASVSESMRAGGPARADQGRIWADLDERFAVADQSSETAAMADLYESEGARLAAYEHAIRPDGYNVGVNDGRAAGQTVMHLHVHLIPRYEGDRPDPRGGVRWIFPDKADYWAGR